MRSFLSARSATTCSDGDLALLICKRIGGLCARAMVPEILGFRFLEGLARRQIDCHWSFRSWLLASVEGRRQAAQRPATRRRGWNPPQKSSKTVDVEENRPRYAPKDSYPIKMNTCRSVRQPRQGCNKPFLYVGSLRRRPREAHGLWREEAARKFPMARALVEGWPARDGQLKWPAAVGGITKDNSACAAVQATAFGWHRGPVFSSPNHPDKYSSGGQM